MATTHSSQLIPEPPVNNRWFDIDKEGLGKLVEQHGKGRLIAELLQNALDEDVTTVAITITPQPGKPLVELTVEDDSPEGFKDLTHAYTLFAESYKKNDPAKRGRFNLGEKLVLAMCRSATISTTTGTVIFSEDGERLIKARSKRERGSVFEAILRMNRSEYDETLNYLHTVLIAYGVKVTLNGQELAPRTPVHVFEATLETEIADEQGVLRTRHRKTQIELHEVKAGEQATLFELGLPVVETQDKWHINVGQKVPLNLNRDNVRPAYLQRLRTLVFNEMCSHLNSEDVNQTWVQEATSNTECSPAGITNFLDLRFGQNRASLDPKDPEAGKRVVANGGTLVRGSMLNGKQWAHAKAAGAIQSAGQLYPTPKPYSNDPNAPPEEILPPEQWTSGMQNIVAYADFLAKELMGVSLRVKISKAGGSFLACYGTGELTFNLSHLGNRWFDQGPSVEVDSLLIHEFGHEYSHDHLSPDYYDALCRLGAKLKALALSKPKELRIFSVTT